MLRGVEFLLNVNLGYRVWLGHKVVVIGGGNVAVDVARTAAREGHRPGRGEHHDGRGTGRPPPGQPRSPRDLPGVARRVPAHGYEVEEAEREGITFHPSTGPKRALGVNGKVVGLETIRCESVFDAEGRFNPRFQAGSESQITTDSIILSVGQTSDLSFLRARRTESAQRRGEPSTSIPKRWRPPRRASSREATSPLAPG